MVDLNTLALPELLDALIADGSLDRLLAAAAAEDLGSAGDVTSRSMIDPRSRARAAVVMREPGVIAGLPVIVHVARAFGGDVDVEPRVADGREAAAGQSIAILDGRELTLLAMERTMLNVLGRMCGVATITRRYVEAVSGGRAVICDTRKTMPGMRALDKYAVRCGRGWLHRAGLHDAALYKDNHLAGLAPDAMAQRLRQAVSRVRAEHDLRFVEVEVDSLDQLQIVLQLEPGLVDVVLLDNMSGSELRSAVELRDRRRPEVKLEASGGVRLEHVRQIAESGVDRISVGALTRSAPSLDVGLDMLSSSARRASSDRDPSQTPEASA